MGFLHWIASTDLGSAAGFLIMMAFVAILLFATQRWK